jgi:hypothetical protein
MIHKVRYRKWPDKMTDQGSVVLATGAGHIVYATMRDVEGRGLEHGGEAAAVDPRPRVRRRYNAPTMFRNTPRWV